ncbi:MAG: GMC family oxidoreductase [Proteobacteria bacterium]|nr:GMC family oxidoreductase [Pseudomonadota bacterium]
MVGSGMGGGTAAAALAAAGRRVLVLERGTPIEDRAAFQDERRMLIERVASGEDPVELNGRAVRPVAGGIPGGSSSLFGAALVRPGPSDFAADAHYDPRLLPAEVGRWPIEFDEWLPYFDAAEELYRVAGDHTAPMPHLGRRSRRYPAALPPLEPISQRLASAATARGLSPFRLPLAIDFGTCLRCPQCPGYLCPTGARASSWRNAVVPAERTGLLEAWTGCEALELLSGRGRASQLRVRFPTTGRETGREERVTAEVFLLAAGALETPALLLRSRLGGQSDQVGRNHMCHLGAVAAACFARPTGAADTFVKQIGLSDGYLGTPEFPHKLGYAQVVPVPGPHSLRKQLGLPLPLAAARALHSRSLLLVGSIEDLPQPDNRVRVGADGRVQLKRRFHPYDVARARYRVRQLRPLLRDAGAAVVFGHVAARAHDHLAHQVGTCRFGRNPRTSVLNAQCRLHDVENVYVVDGSFMPTSLGVGPALTIAANALRVADHVAKELG